jgi:hypothetical protein
MSHTKYPTNFKDRLQYTELEVGETFYTISKREDSALFKEIQPHRKTGCWLSSSPFQTLAECYTCIENSDMQLEPYILTLQVVKPMFVYFGRLAHTFLNVPKFYNRYMFVDKQNTNPQNTQNYTYWYSIDNTLAIFYDRLTYEKPSLEENISSIDFITKVSFPTCFGTMHTKFTCDTKYMELILTDKTQILDTFEIIKSTQIKKEDYEPIINTLSVIKKESDCVIPKNDDFDVAQSKPEYLNYF